MDSNRERVGLMSMIGFYGMPLDYLQVWTQKVESVTLTDIKIAANAYLNPKQWNLLRVGPKARVEVRGETAP
jgi:zinc protease